MKRLMSGNAALGEAAVLAGCTCYFGYPITPQNELIEYMAKRIAEVPGASFIQAESEIAAINMVLGASVAGARAMTSSSSPGISLKQEGISYLCADELPAVIVNMSRGGPGMGNISPAQSQTTCRQPGVAATATTAPSCWRPLPSRSLSISCHWPSTSPTSTATLWLSWATACSAR